MIIDIITVIIIKCIVLAEFCIVQRVREVKFLFNTLDYQLFAYQNRYRYQHENKYATQTICFRNFFYREHGPQ